MVRFVVWSDLHDEFWDSFDLPDLSTTVDGLLIADDTHAMGRHLDVPARAARKYICPSRSDMTVGPKHIKSWLSPAFGPLHA